MRFPLQLIATAAMLLAMCGASLAVDTVVDNDGGAPGYQETGSWTTSTSTGYNGGTYRHTDPARGLSTATWRPTLQAGRYGVYAAYLRSSNRTGDAPYTVTHAGGSVIVHIDQRGTGMTESFLGEYDFAGGTGGAVVLTNNGGTGAYIADAVLFRPVEPGLPQISNVTRTPFAPVSGEPVTVTARVTSTLGLTSVVVRYQVGSGGLVNVTAHDDGAHGDGAAGDDVFGAAIPGQTAGSRISYTVVATNTAGRVVSSATFTFTVGVTVTSEYRSIWVDSWNASFLNATQAQDLINTCRANNINTVMIEIRKIGDAYYNSSIEPRATNISGGASFDPLGYVLQLAHDTSGGKPRIQVHAWFVMHRISRGETLNPQHVLVRHPEYEMVKIDGTRDTTNRYLDPGDPGTVDHNLAVVLDCLSKYDIDGINFDYIRYPESTGPWGYNARSVQRFNAVHGRTGTPASSDPLWGNWRRECVTLEVKKIYMKAWKMKPWVVVSPCTVNWGYSYTNWTASSAYAGVFQDWVGWLQAGIIDYNALMSYATDNTRHQGWTDLSLVNDTSRGSIIGIGAYLQTSVQASLDQLLYARNAGADGLNIYDWGSEVQGNSLGETRANFYQQLKAQMFPTWVDPPVPAWKNNRTTGLLEGNVTLNGQPVDHARVTVEGYPSTQTVTDGSGWYGIIGVATGARQVRFAKSGNPDLLLSVDVNQTATPITLDAELSQAAVDDWALHPAE
jgi:uncharacterized lipoprotein YddW (UPF0748 family)